jgi:hypothetical protein
LLQTLTPIKFKRAQRYQKASFVNRAFGTQRSAFHFGRSVLIYRRPQFPKKICDEFEGKN